MFPKPIRIAIFALSVIGTSSQVTRPFPSDLTSSDVNLPSPTTSSFPAENTTIAGDESGTEIHARPDGGSIKSEIPLPCLVGCQAPGFALTECEDDLSAPGCAGSCNETTYANLVACLDCLAYNGSPENDPTTGASAILTRFNDFCQKQNATVSLVAAITATATTTGPFETTWTGPNVTLATWTGLTPYVTDEASTTSAPSSRGSDRSRADIPTSRVSIAPSASSSGAALRGISVEGKVSLTGLMALAGWLLV